MPHSNFITFTEYVNVIENERLSVSQFERNRAKRDNVRIRANRNQTPVVAIPANIRETQASSPSEIPVGQKTSRKKRSLQQSQDDVILSQISQILNTGDRSCE